MGVETDRNSPRYKKRRGRALATSQTAGNEPAVWLIFYPVKNRLFPKVLRGGAVSNGICYNLTMGELSLGIDEAGRGCVIGPLFIAGLLIQESDFMIDKLNSLGVCDSKLLLAKKREEIAKEIKKISAGYKVAKINPNLLDRFSINDLEIKFSAELIGKFSPSRVYLDVPASGLGIKRYCGSVASFCSSADVKIVGANKMDSTNVAVAGASILAKSEREKHIKILRKKYGDFGSGYPSDPKTISWLKWWKKNKGDWPNIVRKKWGTLNSL